MGNALNFAIIYTAYDRMSAVTDHMGGALVAAGKKTRDFGGNVAAMGEKVAITSALVAAGAAKLHEWSDALFEPAADMEETMNRAAAMTGLNADALAKLKDNAIKFSNTHPGSTAEQYVTAYTSMRSILGDTAEAATGTNTALMMSKLVNIDAASSAGLLAEVQQNLHTEIGATGDMIWSTVRAFAMSGEGVNAFARGIGKLSGAAKDTHTPLAEMLAIMGETTKLRGGARGAQAIYGELDELSKTAAEHGINSSHGWLDMLGQVQSRIAGIPESSKGEVLKGFGLSEEIIPLLEQLDLIHSKLGAAGTGTQTLAQGYGVATAGMLEQTAKFHQALSNLFDAIASPALPTLTAGVNHLGAAMGYLADEAKAHPEIAKWGAIIFAAGASAFVLTAGLLSIAGAALAIGGTIATFVGGMMGLAGAAGGVALFGSVVATAFGVIWSAVAGVGAVMLFNPIMLAIEGIALSAYLIYEYWGPIKGFFEALWGDISSVFNSAVAWMGDVGGRLMHSLAAGIEAAAMYPVHAVEHIAGKVGRYLIGHSPPPEGPLSKMYSAPSLIEAWADTIHPGPIVSAIQRVAAVAAIAAPMMLSPAMAASPAILGSPRGGDASRGSGSFSVSISPTIIVGSGNPAEIEKAVLKALRTHTREVKRILDGEDKRTARKEF